MTARCPTARSIPTCNASSAFWAAPRRSSRRCLRRRDGDSCRRTRTAEIKTLLADLLGLDEIRALGAKALETAKLLKAGLVAVRQERTGLKAEVEQVARELSQLGDTGARIAAAQTAKATQQAALDAAKAELAKHVATRDVRTANGSSSQPTHRGETLHHRGGEGGARCARCAGPAGGRTPGAAEPKDSGSGARRRAQATQGTQRTAHATGSNAQGERRDRTGQPEARAGGERRSYKREAARCRTAQGRRAAGEASGQRQARARADRGNRAGSGAGLVEGAGALASLRADRRSAVRGNGSAGTLQAALRRARSAKPEA